MTGKTNVPMMDKFSLITWGGGSEDEITDMLSAHYAGTINISDYWKVGDTRTVSLAAISKGTTYEAQNKQDIILIIIGINHDDLKTTVNDISKAAITVQTKNCLGTEGYMQDGGTMLWSTCNRRTWCNNDFKSALPSYIQNLIKVVTKYSNRYCDNDSSYRTHEFTTESCFLLSEYEIFGKTILYASTFGSLSADGTQYEYMKTSSNRIKYLGVSTNVNGWYSRTGVLYVEGTSEFVRCNTDGTAAFGFIYTYTGIAPAFCL